MAEGTFVKATAKGYCIGPREVGDVFLHPNKKDGSPPTGSWFKVVEPEKDVAQAAPKAKGRSTILTDEELA